MNSLSIFRALKYSSSSEQTRTRQKKLSASPNLWRFLFSHDHLSKTLTITSYLFRKEAFFRCTHSNTITVFYHPFCRSKRGRKQLGQGSLHRGSRAGGLGSGCREKGVRELWLPAGLSAHSLAGWRHRFRDGHVAHQQDSWGVPWPHHEHL